MGTENIHSLLYLVDLENVGANFLYQHAHAHAESEYIVFCSESTPTPGTVLHHVPEALDISFVDCHNDGKNAMDFCISAMAGVLSACGRPMRILSGDKGYDAIFGMLHRQGVRIEREEPRHHAVLPKGAGGSPLVDNTSLTGAVYKHVPKAYQQAVIAMLPDVYDRKGMHEALQAALPTKLVAATYKKLKKHIPKERMDI